MPAETSLLELHNSSGAVMGEYFGARLPVRFGDFAVEYRAARDAVVLADTNFQALFSFSGPDRQRYVNAVLTSNVRDLQPGQGAIGLLLTAQGHILAEVETYVLPDRVLAVSHAAVRERTFTTFDKFIIMDDVKLEDLTGSMTRLSLAGPRSATVVASLFRTDLARMPEFAHSAAAFFQTGDNGTSVPCRVIRRARYGITGADVLVPQEHAVALWQNIEQEVRAQGGIPAGMEALNAIRLEHGLPWFGYDYDDRQIPHEAAVELSHVNYEKGCYTGQEIVERVRSRGHVNRRLTLLQFFADAPPAPGSKLVIPSAPAGVIGATPETEAGYVTSAAFSPLLGRPIGLGYVRREHSAIGARLDASGIAAEVIATPLQSAPRD